MSCDVINYLITALLRVATTSCGTPFLLTRRLILLPIFVRWLRKALQATLVLLLAPRVVELRREVGAIDYHLSRSISSSRYTPFLRKRSRSLLRNQVVKRTAMACGIGTTTVSRLHKDFQGHEGLLPSPEKRYVES